MEKMMKSFGVLVVCLALVAFFSTNLLADDNPPPGGSIVYGDTNPPPPPPPADNGTNNDVGTNTGTNGENGNGTPPPAPEPSLAESYLDWQHGDDMVGGKSHAWSKAEYDTGENITGTADAISDVSGGTDDGADPNNRSAWSRSEVTSMAERTGLTKIGILGEAYHSTWSEISVNDQNFGFAGNFGRVSYIEENAGGEGAPARLDGYGLSFGWTNVSKETTEDSMRITAENYSEGKTEAPNSSVELSGGSLAQTFMSKGESYTLGQGRNNYNYEYNSGEVDKSYFSSGHTESFSVLSQSANGIYARSKVSSITQSGVKPPDPPPPANNGGE
ncbi:MAG: hypothetical protein ABIG60_03500 [Patescibacteria group bacterium]